jgi:hypothetical protein
MFRKGNMQIQQSPVPVIVLGIGFMLFLTPYLNPNRSKNSITILTRIKFYWYIFLYAVGKIN